jgi:hypothetical protein
MPICNKNRSCATTLYFVKGGDTGDYYEHRLLQHLSAYTVDNLTCEKKVFRMNGFYNIISELCSC